MSTDCKMRKCGRESKDLDYLLGAGEEIEKMSRIQWGFV